MKRAYWPRYAAAAAGFAWFLQIGGGPTLDPRNFMWLMAGDWLQHWLGWLFFRNDPWTFPLGRISSLLYPVGTNIGFTDSNPLVSLLLKPFATPAAALLPVHRPVARDVLRAAGLHGRRAGEHGHEAPVAAVPGRLPLRAQPGAGGPPRTRHALRALADSRAAVPRTPGMPGRRRTHAGSRGWTAAGGGAVGRDSPVPRGDVLGARAGGLRAAVAVAAPHARPRSVDGSGDDARACWRCSASSATFGRAQLGTPGFGAYSSNLLTLVNPMGYSRLLPSVDVPSAQWEGFGFLGAGGLALVASAAVVAVVRRPSTTGTARLAAAGGQRADGGLCGVDRRDRWKPRGPAARLAHPGRHAVPRVRAFHLVAPLPAAAARHLGATRAAGRGRQAVATSLLAGAVVLQAVDLKVDPDWLGWKGFRPAPISNLRMAVGHFRHVELDPMQVFNACGGEYHVDHVYRYMHVAYRLDSTYNSGIFARLPASDGARGVPSADRRD